MYGIDNNSSMRRSSLPLWLVIPITTTAPSLLISFNRRHRATISEKVARMLKAKTIHERLREAKTFPSSHEPSGVIQTNYDTWFSQNSSKVEHRKFDERLLRGVRQWMNQHCYWGCYHYGRVLGNRGLTCKSWLRRNKVVTFRCFRCKSWGNGMKRSSEELF